MNKKHTNRQISKSSLVHTSGSSESFSVPAVSVVPRRMECGEGEEAVYARWAPEDSRLP